MAVSTSWRRPLKLASKLFGSTVIAQIAVLVATAFAASRLTPADFAWYGAVSGAVWIAASFNSMAVEHRLGVVPEERFRPLQRAATASVTTISLLCFVAGALGVVLGRSWGPMAFLVGLAAFGLGIQQVLTGMALRSQRQGLLALGRLVQGLSNAALIVLFVFTPIPGYLGLSLSWAISVFLGLIPLAAGVRFSLRTLGVARPADFRILWGEVKLLPISQLMAGSVASLPLVILPALGNEGISGAWALVTRFLTPMVNTAYNTLQPLYYGGAAELLRQQRRPDFKRFHTRWVALLVAASVPVLVFFILCIAWLIPLLGEEWHVATLVIVPACIYFTSGFIGLPISHTLVLLGRVHAQFWWTVARWVLCLAPFALAGWIGIDRALLAWAVAAAVTFAAQIVMHRRAMRE